MFFPDNEPVDRHHLSFASGKSSRTRRYDNNLIL